MDNVALILLHVQCDWDFCIDKEALRFLHGQFSFEISACAISIFHCNRESAFFLQEV